MWRKRLKDRIRIPRTSLSVSIINFALASMSVTAVVVTFADGRVVNLVRNVVAPPALEYQVASALGCRHGAEADILLLTLQPDGKVRWPDGQILTVEQSSLLMPSWCKKHSEPVLALLADPDMPMVLARPLLATAEELGLSKAILAIPEGSHPPRVIQALR